MSDLAEKLAAALENPIDLTPKAGREHNYLHILSALHEKPWAILPEALETMIDIVEHPRDLNALSAKYGRPLENTGGMVEMRGDTAIIDISGPIFARGNLFTSVSGATSASGVAKAFNTALENPLVARIVLQIDSPGGEVGGINALADQIRAGVDTKPVIAYIEGQGASAAYWIASAASRIVADESAQVGSIGVVATQTDRRAAQEKQGVKTYEIVSSQSPYKRPDPSTVDGRSQIQEMVDSMADLFIGRVAAFRGVTQDTVLQKFGGGKQFGAKKAMRAGMIDKVQAFEPFLAALPRDEEEDDDEEDDDKDARAQAQLAAAAATLEVPMPEPKTTPAAAALPAPAPPATTQLPAALPAVTPRPESEVVAGERSRIKLIMMLPEAKGREELARMLALETTNDVTEAQKILAVAPPGTPAALPARTTTTTFQSEMDRLKNPTVGPAAGEGTPQDEAAAILAFVPKDRRIA